VILQDANARVAMTTFCYDVVRLGPTRRERHDIGPIELTLTPDLDPDDSSDESESKVAVNLFKLPQATERDALDTN